MNFGVIFAGGFANGSYQLGFCKAYNEWFENLRPNLVCGTSIGAWNAYILAGNNNIDQLFNDWAEINETNPLKVRNKIFKSTFLDDITNKYTRISEENHTKIYTAVYNVTDKSLEAHLLNTKSVSYKKTMLKAAVSVPKLAKPVEYYSKFYSDAVIKANIPLRILDGENLDFAFCIYFDPTFIPHHPTVKIIPICLKPDFIISMKQMNFSPKNLNRNFQKGYDDALSVFSTLFPKREAHLDNEAFENFISHTQRHFYISPDMVVDHFNYYHTLSFTKK